MKYIKALLKFNSPITMIVNGVSMQPTLFTGDSIKVTPEKEYHPGDILVFFYKNNNIIVHRLLRFQNDIYYCKGDNSFRMEDVLGEQIIGKVMSINGSDVLCCSPDLITLSYMVNRVFRKSGYDKEITKKSGVYLFYQNYINNEISSNLLYKIKRSPLPIQNIKEEIDIGILKLLEQEVNMMDLVNYAHEFAKNSINNIVTLEYAYNKIKTFLAQAVINELIDIIVI